MYENKVKHVAMIMDGNGRWAERHRLVRLAGHRSGIKTAKNIIRLSAEIGIQALTLFAFSQENWHRPQPEVEQLMSLFIQALEDETCELHTQNVQLHVIGDVVSLNDALRQRVFNAQSMTKNNTGLRLNVAFNYSGKWDLINAARQLLSHAKANPLAPEQIDESVFAQYLCLHDLPEPDLLIRTGGDQRLSNFMLWQFAYTELFFIKTLWPDFTLEEYQKILHAFSQRQRRFGRTSEQIANTGDE